jgi:hypothetical protein
MVQDLPRKVHGYLVNHVFPSVHRTQKFSACIYCIISQFKSVRSRDLFAFADQNIVFSPYFLMHATYLSHLILLNNIR